MGLLTCACDLPAETPLFNACVYRYRYAYDYVMLYDW